MKTRVKLLFMGIIIVLIFMMGCKKEPVIPAFQEFGDQAGPEIIEWEYYVNTHRGGLSHPDACDALATLVADDIQSTLHNEMINEIDMFTVSATKMYREKESYESLWNWWNVSRSRLIKELQGKDKDIVNDEVVRVLPVYAEMLEKRVIPYVLDNICYGGGVRDDWTDQWIQNTFTDTVPYDIEHERWKPTSRMECYYYYYYYAVDPGNYAEAKSMGLPVPSVDSLMVIYPYEEIMKQSDLKSYRKECIKKHDFMQVEWKPVIDSKVLIGKDENRRLGNNLICKRGFYSRFF